MFFSFKDVNTLPFSSETISLIYTNEITASVESSTTNDLVQSLENITLEETIQNVSQTFNFTSKLQTLSTKLLVTTTSEPENKTANAIEYHYEFNDTEPEPELKNTTVLEQTLSLETTTRFVLLQDIENSTFTLENVTLNKINVTENTFSETDADLNKTIHFNLTIISESHDQTTASSSIVPTKTEISSLPFENSTAFYNSSLNLKKNITIEMNENAVGKQVILTSDLSKQYQNGLVFWRQKHNQTLDLSLFVDLFSQTQVKLIF